MREKKRKIIHIYIKRSKILKFCRHLLYNIDSRTKITVEYITYSFINILFNMSYLKEVKKIIKVKQKKVLAYFIKLKII
ncbi:hypothetical protein PFBG_02771 [Plasmodium falciparum 7G8]|uniref:Uncharacterized protein n=3 Tax=Plasmodium falciparum TaxID=5833 RepID=A0A024X7U0_PLAFC|nr:hypothetical protein PFNF135_02855 [Plasmodium falciparum NF135/5.C10]ETW61253.1 hypothetical protein PFMC_02673 [Plasmodium falciparum CAMP/Malaysia]EUR72104.1 hypothetical protein PFBG_02771 [Plasmodium falciparum 7G8]